MHIKYQIGIDEAGRGPLAGPVSVGIVLCLANFKFSIFKNLKDSKKLSEERREEIFKQIKKLDKENKLKWAVTLVSEKIIDKKGISTAIKIGIKKCLDKVGANPKNTLVLLDGGIYAPEEFKNQQTIIKGDEKEAVISLASICAKVVRDRKMVTLSKKHPKYSLEIHKGYGTKKHRDLIQKYGLCALHRKSFCKKF